MDTLRGKILFEKFKTAVKILCTVFAAFSLTVFGGCGLFPPFGDDNKNDAAEDVVSVSPLSAQVKVGESVTLTATSSENRAIIWISSDDEIAEVDGGVVTGISVGAALITASDGKQMASCEIEVIPADDKKPDDGGEEKDPPALKISTAAITVSEGDYYNLVAQNPEDPQAKIVWETSNPSVATVDGGKVTGISKGEAIITASCSSAAPARCTVTVVEAPKKEYKLVWSDEFDGNSLDTTKWGYQTGVQDDYYGNKGPIYWGNGELEYYTDGANLKVSDGALQITAKRENMPDGRTYSSSRITTRDKYSVTYGLIEARMKTPAIEGMWPAFWMLPQPPDHSTTNNEYGGWPANGELDIMEAKGRLKNTVDTTLHFGGPDWNVHDMEGKSTQLSSSTEEWHTYAVEWTSDFIAWRIDGEEVKRVLNNRYWSSATSSNPSAPFDKPFFILLNLAVGGQYDGYRVPPESFTQASMYVDYVRVYQKQ